jgi:hypothetical protein
MRPTARWTTAALLCTLAWLAAAAEAPKRGAAALDPASYPHKVLSNGLVKLTVEFPDARRGYYRGPRFDWSGMIVRAEYRGHSFFGDWKTTHDPDNNDDTTGPAEEYGMAAPLGYADAKVGETFLKIGVGCLQRIDEPAYRFGYAYKIVKPGSWKVTRGDDWIEFHQDMTGEHGYGYSYTKRVELVRDRPAFTISHTLRNTGSKALRTNQYCHNFLLIDGERIGPAYRVRLPFVLRSKDGKATRGPIEVRGKEIVLRDKVAEGASFYAEFSGPGPGADGNRIEVRNQKTGAGVRITGTQPLAEFHVWGTKDTVSVEPFIELDLAPGKEAKWQNAYTLLVGPDGKD